jgi:Secretion system C-terminal sorting domain
MRYFLILVLVSFATASYDVNGDGITDWHQTILKDEDNDGSFDYLSHTNSCEILSDSLIFTKVWDSGSYLNNQWGADCGYFDDDSLLDLLGTHFNPNQLHVFESDGQGGYNHIWVQTDSMPPGSYGAVAHGDPDDDGQIEILGGDVSTLGKVVLFENIADDTWGEPQILFRTNLRLRAIRIADTNRNDTNEIIVFCGNTDGGKVQIYEHTGAPGVNTYTLRYEYTTISYLFNGEVGDADNDGYPEMLLGIGGMSGYPMYIRRIVYDPNTRTYSHHMYESSIIGLDIAPQVGDVDNSGTNELIVGSSGDPNGQFHIFKYIRGDTFQPLWSSNMTTEGNVISVHTARFRGYEYPIIFAAPFGGAVYGFVKDSSAWHDISYFLTSGPVRSIGSAQDKLPGDTIIDQLVLSENGVDQITVWRPPVRQGIFENSLIAPVPALKIFPNPARSSIWLMCNDYEKIDIYDCQGRLVRTLVLNESNWNLTDQKGKKLKSGIYFLQSKNASATTKLIISR